MAAAHQFIALLRGINVGGHNKLPMADLRALCADIGWTDVQTYIQSGNILFRANGSATRQRDVLESAIAERFGSSLAVVVRPAADLIELMAGNPFPAASATEPNRVMLALSRSPPNTDAADQLRPRAVQGERIEQIGEALWIHFPRSAGTSKLTPTLLDRAAGAPTTMRNWRTVQKLAEMAGLPAPRLAQNRSPEQRSAR